MTTWGYDSATRPSFNVYRRWGIEISKAGYTAVPNYLVYANLYLDKEMKLSPSEYWALNIIISCWREPEKPQASKKFIADRMGVSERQVQRIVRSLENKGLVIANAHHDRQYKANEFSLGGVMTFITYVWRMTEEKRAGARKTAPKFGRADLFYCTPSEDPDDSPF